MSRGKVREGKPSATRYATSLWEDLGLAGGGLVAIRMDLLFLFGFGIVTLLIATPLFKRIL